MTRRAAASRRRSGTWFGSRRLLGIARRFACASSRGLISRAREGRSRLTPRPEREFAQLAVPTSSWIAVPSPARWWRSLPRSAALALPAVAEAHSSAPVIAVDYEAKLARSAIAPGVTARVLDGNRKLELTVRPPHTVVVEGYGGEPFLRFDGCGRVGERAVADGGDEQAHAEWRHPGSREGGARHDGGRSARATGSPGMTTGSRSCRARWRERGGSAPGRSRSGSTARRLRVQGGLWHDPGRRRSGPG